MDWGTFRELDLKSVAWAGRNDLVVNSLSDIDL